ncbi:MAG TPA: AmmeMemoRadiSam system protein B [Candidatus Hydrogenedentes bacterium]|nr:AmmeMemoRadiSam system protein B [Candidatus Hydrogenedentota bacterium]HNT86359.1 AmmeMemoRadiSam system protein B [Candidatus Hydrogenedentota bacterium]
MKRGHSIGLYLTAFLVLGLLVALYVTFPVKPTPESRPAPPERPKNVFHSPLAGQWYTADAAALTKEIAGYLDEAETAPLDNVIALIQPHAGYQYSGRVAAHGVKAVAGKPFRRVIVLGPSHRLPMENTASVPDATHYATPLGETPLDLEFIDALKRHPCFQTHPYADDEEHSVQIQLPLLQQALGDFRLVPIVVGDLDADTAHAMADVLRGLIDDRTLIVASSDFTHYGPRYGYVPFQQNVPDELEKLDMAAYEQIEKKDLDGFIAYLRRTGATVCGRAPISILLALLPPAAEARMLRYDTSGRITGDFANSVSYFSIAFTGTWGKGEAVAPAAAASALTDADQHLLLALARKTIAYALAHRRVPEIDELGLEITPNLRQVRGAFVTLNENEALRGCIGDIFPARPLYKAVLANAINAAFNDRRFTPLQPDELDKLHIEISALTPPAPVASPEDIVIGRDGVVLSKDGHSAVFLPQVAPEQGWDRETMLNHLALKASLPEDAWREGATFQVFQADVFKEAQ